MTPAGLRILVVDDDADTRDMLAVLLAAEGHEVTTAGDAVGAVACFERRASDAVLMDIALPDGDGYELARRLRAMPGGRASLFVAVTGYGRPEDVWRADAAGFDLHLVKPLDPARLCALLAARGSRHAAA